MHFFVWSVKSTDLIAHASGSSVWKGSGQCVVVTEFGLFIGAAHATGDRTPEHMLTAGIFQDSHATAVSTWLDRQGMRAQLDTHTALTMDGSAGCDCLHGHTCRFWCSLSLQPAPPYGVDLGLLWFGFYGTDKAKGCNSSFLALLQFWVIFKFRPR